MNTESVVKQGDRSITTRFVLTDPSWEVEEYEDTYRPALDITTSHDKDRKMLVTSITRIMLSGRIIRWKMELRDEDPAPVNVYVGERIARYSKKALDARHYDVILANIQPSLPALIEWASRATI